MNKNIKNLMESLSYAKLLKQEVKEINKKNEDLLISGAFHDTGRDISDIKSKPVVTVCVDFDGTMVKHEYPEIGEEADHCVETLKHWVDDYNVGIILDTMRSDDTLEEAVNWCKEKGIKLYSIAKDPDQQSWTNSPKAYAPFSIDDRNIGCPLVYGKSKRPYVDWLKVRKIFEPIIVSMLT